MNLAELTDLQKLTVEEKLQWIEELWVSVIPEMENESLTGEQGELLEERLKADIEHPEDAITHEELMRRVAALR